MTPNERKHLWSKPRKVVYIDHDEELRRRMYELQEQLRDWEVMSPPNEGNVDKVIRWYEARVRSENQNSS